MFRRSMLVVVFALLVLPAAAAAAEPTLTPNSQGKGKIAWTGAVSAGTAEGGTTDDCFDANDKPDTLSGCHFFRFRVNTPKGFYTRFLGGVQVTVTGFAPFDVDMAVYRLKKDGSHGIQAGASGNAPGEDEITTMPDANGRYILAVVPFAAPPGTTYNGVAQFNLSLAKPRLAALNKRIGPGPKNYRASHDRYVSHSEPSIAMDPLDHNHLVAGSKMYESLPKYFFKIGTYESFDGGRHWRDLGQLPGYCRISVPADCNPKSDDYRVVSDIALAFDDEGNAYGNTLDAPGGADGTGWNQTVAIKKRGAKQFSKPIVVHDNRNNPLTEQTFLDDKNWIAVDNNTTTTGAKNRPHDGKIGTIYVCWGLDGAVAPTQQIVLMRSEDGGHTWGGEVPGDNTPIQLSQKQAISGIGCHIIIGPAGEVYVTWYDNQLDALMQVKSIDRGRTFTPARPIATIVGVNEQFERQSFRNLSIPTTGIDKKGNVYVVDASLGGEGGPVTEETPAELKQLAHERRAEEEAAGEDSTGADIVMFKSTDGGNSYTGPIRVNQDGKKSHRDQFQPWMAITPKGQLNVMYFDKRRDPNDFFLGETLSRSNDGGKHWKDTRVDHQMWDPRINPPISPSGQFIGDYQGLVADDKVAIPFWNDTQAANRKKGSKGYSPWQEVYAARIPNGKGGKCRDHKRPRTSLPRKNVSLDSAGRMHMHGKARDKGCHHKLKRVRVSIAKYRHEGGKCRFLKPDGTFTPARSCRKRVLMPATGKQRWHFATKTAVPEGKYRITAAAVDRAGNREKPVLGRNTVKFRVR